jgi:hypothetical protein
MQISTLIVLAAAAVGAIAAPGGGSYPPPQSNPPSSSSTTVVQQCSNQQQAICCENSQSGLINLDILGCVPVSVLGSCGSNTGACCNQINADGVSKTTNGMSALNKLTVLVDKRLQVRVWGPNRRRHQASQALKGLNCRLLGNLAHQKLKKL